MKNRIIRIALLTALIAVALIGMTNPSTVLGAKPRTEYTVVVVGQCDTCLTKDVDVDVEFWAVDSRTGVEDFVGGATPFIVGGIDADAKVPYFLKPTKWILRLYFLNQGTNEVVCYFDETGEIFPATVTRTCSSGTEATVTVTIGNPRVFP